MGEELNFKTNVLIAIIRTHLALEENTGEQQMCIFTFECILLLKPLKLNHAQYINIWSRVTVMSWRRRRGTVDDHVLFTWWQLGEKWHLLEEPVWKAWSQIHLCSWQLHSSLSSQTCLAWQRVARSWHDSPNRSGTQGNSPFPPVFRVFSTEYYAGVTVF